MSAYAHMTDTEIDYRFGIPEEIIMRRYGLDEDRLHELVNFNFRPAGDPDRPKHGTSRKRTLSMQDAREIRLLYASGGMTQEKIAAQYNTSQGIVSSIVLNKTYKEK